MTDTASRDLEDKETKEINNLEDDSPPLTTESEDVIPNAIVIKNIPFAIKREQLLDTIDEMGLPLPYAFNYHFDNGIFRGLAFANFTTPEDTLKVIQGLNGKDINGRKLKVEYKKLLPQHERERIEREKREKRGQLEEQHKNMSNISLQSLNRVISNTTSNTFLTNNNNNNNNNNMNSMNIAQPIVNSTSTFTNLTNPQLSNHFMGGPIQTNILQQPQQQPLLVAQHTANSLYSNSNNINSPTERYYAPLPSSSNVPIPPQQLDFNDPDTLEIYSQLLLFKDREKAYYELAYPAGLSANHKRIINVLCSFLNLMEVYDSRFVIIRRKNISLSNVNGQGNVLDHINLQKHLQQVQPNYTNQNSMLQPTSTGGSLNRSQSYTSLLQAHASSMSISLNNNSNNNNGSPTGNNNLLNTPKIPQGSQLLAQQPSGNISNTNTSGTNTLNSIYNNSNSSTNNLNGSSTNANSTTSPEPLQHPQPILSTQQQSFIRQQATLTPSSRVPSGYSSHHQTINASNPLLRNVALSPTTNVATPNTNSSMVNHITTSVGSTLANINNNGTNNITSSNRLTSSLYNNASNTNLLLNDPVSKPLVPQNTNGSIHSNFSIQSYQDDTLFGNINGNGNTQSSNNRDNTNTNIANSTNNADILYRTLSQSGALDNTDLDNHLARSLSGLDVQDSKKNNIW